MYEYEVTRYLQTTLRSTSLGFVRHVSVLDCVRRLLGSEFNKKLLASFASVELARAWYYKMEKEGNPILAGQKPSQEALFHEKGKSPKEKIVLYLFVAFVVIMVGITLIISMYRGSTKDSKYVLLGISILSIGFLEGVLVHWTRTGELPAQKLWFLYFVGTCLILESIFTDVLLFHDPQ